MFETEEDPVVPQYHPFMRHVVKMLLTRKTVIDLDLIIKNIIDEFAFFRQNPIVSKTCCFKSEIEADAEKKLEDRIKKAHEDKYIPLNCLFFFLFSFVY